MFTSYADTLPDPVFKTDEAGATSSTGNAGPGFAKVKFTSSNQTQVQRTISGRGVTASPSYHQWSFNISYNPLTRDEFEPVTSFLESRNGRRNPFYVVLPQYNKPRDSALYPPINQLSDPYGHQNLNAYWGKQGIDPAGWYTEAASGSNNAVQLGVPHCFSLATQATATRKHLWSQILPATSFNGKVARLQAIGINSSQDDINVLVRFFTTTDRQTFSDLTLTFPCNSGSTILTRDSYAAIPAGTLEYEMVIYNQGTYATTINPAISYVRLTILEDFASLADLGIVTASATTAGSQTLMVNNVLVGEPMQGDFFTITDPNDINHKKAYKVVGVETNTHYKTGTTQPNTTQRKLRVAPPITRNVSAGATVNFINPKFRVIQSSDTLEHELDTDNLYSFSLSLEEILP